MKYATYRDYRNYTLNVTNLNKDLDSGMYQCFAKNDGGEDMAYTAINVQSKQLHAAILNHAVVGYTTFTGPPCLKDHFQIL